VSALRTALVVVVFAVGSMLAVTAHAQRERGPVPAEVLIVLATTNGERNIDRRLADVPALRQPPFNTYRSLTLLDSPEIELRIGRAHEVPLPNGRRIRIVLREITSDGRYRFQVSINRPGEQDYLPELSVVASPGDPFFIAGQSFRDGTLVIGFRLGPRSRT
jgi:hypothetical protein